METIDSNLNLKFSFKCPKLKRSNYLLISKTRIKEGYNKFMEKKSFTENCIFFFLSVKLEAFIWKKIWRSSYYWDNLLRNIFKYEIQIHVILNLLVPRSSFNYYFWQKLTRYIFLFPLLFPFLIPLHRKFQIFCNLYDFNDSC